MDNVNKLTTSQLRTILNSAHKSKMQEYKQINKKGLLDILANNTTDTTAKNYFENIKKQICLFFNITISDKLIS